MTKPKGKQPYLRCQQSRHTMTKWIREPSKDFTAFGRKILVRLLLHHFVNYGICATTSHKSKKSPTASDEFGIALFCIVAVGIFYKNMAEKYLLLVF